MLCLMWPCGVSAMSRREGGVTADRGGEAAFEDVERFVFTLVDVAGRVPGGGAALFDDGDLPAGVLGCRYVAHPGVEHPDGVARAGVGIIGYGGRSLG